VVAEERNYIPALSNLALVYGRLGLVDEAMKTLKQALQLAPQNPTLHFNLGVMAQQQGSLEQARIAFRKVLDLEPPDSPRRRQALKKLEGLENLETLRRPETGVH
jgi:tetratricopeptide (TPR) repeat protein